METIHKTKNQDYATTTDPLKNFKDSNEFAARFPKEFAAFTVLIGTKLSRLSNLMLESKKPNHESIEDTFIDVANYFLLWRSYYIESTVEPSLAGLVQELTRAPHIDSVRSPLSRDTKSPTTNSAS